MHFDVDPSPSLRYSCLYVRGRAGAGERARADGRNRIVNRTLITRQSIGRSVNLRARHNRGKLTPTDLQSGCRRRNTILPLSACISRREEKRERRERKEGENGRRSRYHARNVNATSNAPQRPRHRRRRRRGRSRKSIYIFHARDEEEERRRRGGGEEGTVGSSVVKVRLK